MFIKKRKRKMSQTDQQWFDDLNEESQQDVCIRYLRSLDKTSLNALYQAVELYRQGDAKLGRVKDPEAEKKAKQADGPEDTSGFIATEQE